MTKTQLVITGGIGALGVIALVYLKKNKGSQVIFVDEYGGAPAIDSSYYFPREGNEEPLPPFPATLGFPKSIPIGAESVLPPIRIPIDYEIPEMGSETPPEKPVTEPSKGCTDVCNSCAGTAQPPFNGSGVIPNFQSAMRIVLEYAPPPSSSWSPAYAPLAGSGGLAPLG